MNSNSGCISLLLPRLSKLLGQYDWYGAQATWAVLATTKKCNLKPLFELSFITICVLCSHRGQVQVVRQQITCPGQVDKQYMYFNPNLNCPTCVLPMLAHISEQKNRGEKEYCQLVLHVHHQNDLSRASEYRKSSI